MTAKNSSYTGFIISMIVLIIYVLYILAVKGISGLLLSASVGLITAYYIDEFEIVTATVVIFGLVYVFMMNILPRCLTSSEGFDNTSPPGLKGQNMCPGNINASTPVPEGGIQIVDRISRWNNQWSSTHYQNATPTLIPNPKPVFSTKGIEGFANANVGDDSEEKVVGNAEKKAEKDENNTALPDEEAEIAQSQPATPLTKNNEEGMNSIGGNGLFKLGEMPSETSSGAYVDVGTTLMKAMNSLKPEQVNAMTSETRQLVETQKNLIQMLQTMKPVLQDGRQLLDTFTGIFGSGKTGVLAGEYQPGVRQ